VAATTPGTAALDAPVTGSEVRSVNFFNGRLLTGQDLSREQDANRAARLALGRALGSGVACGLFVEPGATPVGAAPVLSVRAGIAVNSAGQVLSLPIRTDVSLAAAPPGADPTRIGFVDCLPPTEDIATIGEGVFVLTIAPATGLEGRAEVSGLVGDAACAAALSVETVKFRLLRLPIAASTLHPPGLVRSKLAAQLLTSSADVTAAPPATPLDQQGHLRSDEVPLALIHWTAVDGLRFIDCWAVRRELHSPDASGALPGLLPPAADGLARARLLQFQAQIAELVAPGGAAALRGGDHFVRLPPAGLLPAGVNGTTFLTGMTVRQGRARGTPAPLVVEPARVRAFLAASLAYPPIEVVSPEAVWLLAVRGASYGLFASAHVPYPAQPQFDVGHYDQANYALNAP
jgi:hypothetical protein